MNRISYDLDYPIVKGSLKNVSDFERLSERISKNKILMEKDEDIANMKIFIDDLSEKFPEQESAS